MINYTYIVAVVGNIISFVCGTSLSWSSPVLSKLNVTNVNADDFPFDHILSDQETSLIGSLLSLGAVFGPFASGFSADKIGRKYTLLLLSIPFIVGYLMLAFAKLVPLYYVARLLVGFGVGGSFTVIPIYIGEISDDSNRGPLSSFMNVLLCAGLLLAYGIGPYISIMAFNIVLAVVPAVFLVSFFFLGPESPHYYVKKGDLENAKSALKKLRGVEDVEKELEEIKASVEKAADGTISDLFKSKGLIRALIISLALVTFQQFSGINAVLFYAQSIFQASGSSLQPEISSIIIGAVQFVTSFITPTVAGLLGRKTLLCFSGVGMLVSEVPLGVYFFLKDQDSDVGGISWLPVLCLVFYILTYNSGFGPLPWAVMGEIFPPHVKSTASSFTASFCWLISFLITMFFSSVVDGIGMGPSFWIFSGFCLASFLFTFFFVIETKGKSLQEIQDALES